MDASISVAVLEKTPVYSYCCFRKQILDTEEEFIYVLLVS